MAICTLKGQRRSQTGGRAACKPCFDEVMAKRPARGAWRHRFGRQRVRPAGTQPRPALTTSLCGPTTSRLKDLLLNFNAMLFKFTPDAARGEAKVDCEPPLAQRAVAHVSVPLSARPAAKIGAANFKRRLFPMPTSVRFAMAPTPSACGEQKWPVAYVRTAQLCPPHGAGHVASSGWTASAVRCDDGILRFPVERCVVARSAVAAVDRRSWPTSTSCPTT
jgi:hypothetical protein